MGGERNRLTLVVRERRTPRVVQTLPPGSMLGSYRIFSLIGQGAVGSVYLAEHVKLGRKVAIKVLRTDLSEDAKVLKRFFAEARAANAIAHENIVAITDFSEDEKQPYFIMEHLVGRTLGELIEEEGALPIDQALAIMRQLLSALDAAHSKSIVHRDLKPANIFLIHHAEQRDFVKLLDFGVAKLGASDLFAADTKVGDLCGTPDYMSPEQTRGLEVDHRSDIYAAGVILFEMLTGQKLFSCRRLDEVLEAHQRTPPRKPSEVAGLARPIPPALEELVLAALAKKPSARPQTAADFKKKIEAIRREASMPAVMVPEIPSLVMVRPVPDHQPRWIFAAVALIVVAAAVLIGAAVMMTSEKEQVVRSIAIPVPKRLEPPPTQVQPEPEPEPELEPESESEPVQEASAPIKAKKAKKPKKTVGGPIDETTTINPF